MKISRPTFLALFRRILHNQELDTKTLLARIDLFSVKKSHP
jgi:hypothetical protein